MKFLYLGLLIALSGCSVAAIRKHEPNFRNVRELEKVRGSYFVSDVKALSIEMNNRLKSESLTCRLTTFNMPAGMRVADYIKTALNDELDAARKLDAKGTPIVVVVNSMESSSASFDKGHWTIDFDYQVGGKTYNSKGTTAFESAYMAETACRNTANALTDALSENFSGLYKKLLK